MVLIVRFPYREEKSKIFGVIHRPVAELFFINGDKKILEYPYVDSGADVSLIPKSVGDLLGLVYEKSEIKEVTGVCNCSIPVVIKEIEIEIDGHRFKSRIAWSMSEKVPMLLGRLDVFLQFKVILDEEARVVEFVNKLL